MSQQAAALFRYKEVVSGFPQKLTLVVTVNSTDLQESQITTYNPCICVYVNIYIYIYTAACVLT